MDLLLPAVGSCPCHAEPGLTHLPSNRPQAVSAQSLGQEVPAWGPAGAEPQTPTPRFAILPVLVPGRAVGVGRAEASGLGHIWWEGPWGPRGQGAETGRCGASVTAQRGTGVAPGGRARAEDVTHRSEGDIDHRSPALQLGLGDTQSTRGLPTPQTEGTCRWPRWGPPAPGGQGPLCPLLS